MVLRIMLAFIAILMGFSSFADGRVCEPETARRAELAVVKVKNWYEVYEAYSKYQACDDGAIGEGFSDSVGRLLEMDWMSISELGRLVEKDENFKQFILKHIDETLAKETLHDISKNSRNKCPTRQAVFCRQIEAAANKAGR